MSDHIDDTKTNLRLLEEAQTCEASPADDTSAIQEALAQEIQNVTADIPKLDLTGISEEEPQPSLPEEASSTGSVSEQEPVSSWFLTFMCHNYLSSLPVLYPTLFFNIFFHYTPIFFHVYEESMKLSLMNCSIILKLHQAPS